MTDTEREAVIEEYRAQQREVVALQNTMADLRRQLAEAKAKIERQGEVIKECLHIAELDRQDAWIDLLDKQTIASACRAALAETEQ